jgi:predicted flap endonuclease-1-like 5' DNA nuclease
MPKNKLSKKVLKAFLNSIKKIESIDLKDKYEEAGKIVANYALILKHKEGKKTKLIKLIKAISDDTGVTKLLAKKSKKSKDKLKAKTSSKPSGKKSNSKKEAPEASKKKSSKPSKKVSKEKGKSLAKTAIKLIAKADKPSSSENNGKSEVKIDKKVSRKPKPEANKVVAVKAISPNTVKKTTAKVAPTAKTQSIKPVVVKAPIVKKATATTVPKVQTAKKTITKAETVRQTVVKKPIQKVAVKTKIVQKAASGDNLKLIEGIGPKIETFLKEDGIDSFAKLAKAIPEKIQTMLVAKGGTRYNANNPITWPEQAVFAAKGDMAGLKALKLVLKGGRKV